MSGGHGGKHKRHQPKTNGAPGSIGAQACQSFGRKQRWGVQLIESFYFCTVLVGSAAYHIHREPRVQHGTQFITSIRRDQHPPEFLLRTISIQSRGGCPSSDPILPAIGRANIGKFAYFPWIYVGDGYAIVSSRSLARIRSVAIHGDLVRRSTGSPFMATLRNWKRDQGKEANDEWITRLSG